METGEQWGKIMQVVEFENLFNNLEEIKDFKEQQEKLVIPNKWVRGQVPLWRSLGFYYGEDSDLLYNRRELRERFFAMFPSFRFSDNYLQCNNVRWTLLYLSKCFQNDNKYIFVNKDWCIYSVDKKEFDEKWFMAESFVLFCEPESVTNSQITCSVRNWKVEYSLNNTPEWTLEWTCFCRLKVSSNSNEIYVGNKSYIYKSYLKTGVDAVTKQAIIAHKDDDAIDLWLWEIKKITLDANKNLIFIVSEDDDWNSDLHILDHKKLFAEWAPVIDEIKKIEWVSDVDVLIDGNLILHRTNWKLDILNTNLNSLNNNVNWWFQMKKILVNKARNSTKKDVLDSLGTWTISLDDNEISNEWNEEDEEIINWIWNNQIEVNGTTLTLKDLFDKATTEEEIQNVRKWFHVIIKKNEKLSRVPELLKVVDRRINEKNNRIVLKNIFEELWDLADELWTASDLITLITIQDKLKLIKKKRKNIQAWIVDEDKELDKLLKAVAVKISEYQEEHKEDCEAEIENNFEWLQEILNDIMNLIDISTIYTNPLYEATKNMIDNLTPESKDKYNKKLKELINKRREEIKSESDKVKKEAQSKIDSLKKDVQEDIEQIKETIDDIDSIEAVEQIKESDPLVLKIKEKLAELPSSDAQKLDLTLDRIFSERIFKLRLWWEESRWVIQNLDSYWIDTMLYYNEDWSEKVEWKLESIERPDWKISLVVKLMNWETHEYDKTLYLKEIQKYWWVRIRWKKIKFDMDQDEFEDYAEKLYDWKEDWVAEKYYGLIKELRRLSLLWNDKEGVSEEKNRILAKLENIREKYGDLIYTEHLIARLIKQQKLNPRSKVPPFDPYYIVLDEEKEILKKLSGRLVDQKQNSGIEILEWWPWLWKTVMCEFLANVTNREIIRVQCSKMDPNDMFFASTLKKNEVTREPADWIRLMQKPGTIILFDEIDKLNDQCFERLHSLFDRSRSVYDWHLWTIKANPDCLFLWTRNTYDRLSNPILSRWRILQVKYPWLLNEAFKISKYTTSNVLRKMSYDEFKMLYDKYINRWEWAPTSAQEKSIYELVQNINHLLNVFNKLREQYWADEPFAFELSYRDARQIFVDYNGWLSFKEALEWVLIPKAMWAVLDPDDKKTQEGMVRDAINEEMWL